MAEVIGIPEVHPGLVLGFEHHPEVGQFALHAFLHAPLGGFTQVLRIEVEEVVVLDGLGRVAALTQVPDGLEQAARHQPAVR